MKTLIRKALENTDRPGMLSGENERAIGVANIVVVGSGGAGNNTIHRLKNVGITGAQLIAVNTDKQHLAHINADKRILVGNEITRGLGAGGDPEVGEQAALEAKPGFKEIFNEADLVFVTGGLGGGTGTGTLPVIAEVAKSCGALVIGAVTMPFKNERARVNKARIALAKLRNSADSVVVIDNNKLLEIASELPVNEAFAVADEVLSRMVKGITETISIASLMNLDFADVRTVMGRNSGKGIAVIGLGESDTRNRAEESVTYAMENPLLDVDYRDATGALIHITGGEDLTLGEATGIVDLATTFLTKNADVIWGARIDPEYNGRVQVMVIMTGVTSPDLAANVAEPEIHIPSRVKVGNRSYFSRNRRFKSSEQRFVVDKEKGSLMSTLGIDEVFS
ncbi:MAG TPA: cell division protein FtsZ [Euryarchaeota archaeon]|nr:cell division protein FtsZ [archaeon BMS3Bbin15]HDL15814.1 cell division protein FtsZ [Euryarchaeota archaeon]